MGILIFAGAFGGTKLDNKLNLTFPVFTVILSLLGVFIALYLVIKEFIQKK